MPKGTSWAEATSNSEKIKPVALAVIKLCLTEGISQAVSKSVNQAVSQKKIPFNNFIKKCRGNFLKAFWVDLKACLGLVLPTPSSFGKIVVVFG